ncbi:hypothetical protein KI688_012321 [Linnemannia hyalina]|uniref:Uncharacterized protein n=1 Tax=Linnemannia hyalina TaxID=64524 RepID=A0A9P7XVU1_9FUNG|nr:hypothetical protein KI688_012321 [Linnemannia hyalina]
MKKSFGSPPPAARRRTTSPGTIAGRNIPDLGSRKGSSNHAPEGSEDRDSDVLTQSVRFDPKSIRSTSTPASGSEDSVGSASGQESEGESAGEGDDGEYDCHVQPKISNKFSHSSVSSPFCYMGLAHDLLHGSSM